MGETADIPPGKSRLKTLGIRILTGLALVAICGLPIYYGGFAIYLLVLILGVRVVYEWVRMTDRQAGGLALAVPVLALLLVLGLAWCGAWSLALGGVCLFAVLAMVERLRRGGALWAAFGVLYVLLPSLAIVWLRGMEKGVTAPGFAKFLFVLVIVVLADSFAYLGGSTIGGPKLAPKISPNKTWSGFISGLVFAMIGGAVFAKVAGFDMIRGGLLALPLVLLAVAGDFLESWVKRRLGVKDAGGILPGHGGLLDRIDSLLLAVGGAALALLLWPTLWPLVS